jgi:hypothetical protein
MTTDKPDPRDAILERFERGEITKEQADVEAVAAGFGSMERSPNLAGADCFDLATWTMPELMAWVIYRTSEAVLALAEENRIRTLVWQGEDQFDVNGNKAGVFWRLRPPDKKSLFDVVVEADTRERQEGLTLSAIRKRADLEAGFIRGELAAYGIKRGEAEHSAIPAAAWATIDLFDEPCTHFEPEDVGRQREETPRYTDVYVISEDVRRLGELGVHNAVNRINASDAPIEARDKVYRHRLRLMDMMASRVVGRAAAATLEPPPSPAPVQQTVPSTDSRTVEELKRRTREIIVRRGLPRGIGRIVANELNIETRTAQRYVQEIKNDMS